MGPLAVGSAYAQDTAQQEGDQSQQNKDATELDRIIVTGSLIPQTQIETASPVIKITAEDIQKQGFRNVYEALRSMPLATGSVQDSQFTNGFTPGANTISLLGLDPSFTLVLLNGRPLADYPFLYNSSSNFADLATIPTFLIERVDILPGNQSAIYGSSAIAGVVNIILKKNLEGFAASYRVGTYTDGGGASQDYTLAGGHNFGDLNVMFGIELKNQDPIFGSDRSYTDSSKDGPTPNSSDAERDRLVVDPFTGLYIDPGDKCDPISYLFDGDLKKVVRSPTTAGGASAGSYCGSTEALGNRTFMNGREDYNGYVSASYRFNDNAELYADALYNLNKVSYRVGGTAFWALGRGTAPYVYDLDSQRLVGTLQHVYAPEEIGNLADAQGIQHAYVANVGIRGTIGQSNWDYDAYYHRSAFQSKFSSRRALTTQVNDFFLGPQEGTDPYGYGYPAYHIEQNGKFWGAVTPGEFLSYTDLNVKNSNTYSQQIAATVTNTNLFDLPAGPVGFAGLVEVGNQFWDDPVDPRVTAGEFWGTGGTSGRGKRKRQAIGAEVNVPIFSNLTASGSARYDRYSAAGNEQGKTTYKLGLEFRPFESLLVRGNYATAFRAPDMGYIFSGGSITFTSVQDVYNCRIVEGDGYQDCNPPFDSVQVQSGSVANKDLEYITSKSWGLGFVWSPMSNLNFKADYYHVQIDNQVSNYGLSTIMEREADCRLGHREDGTPVDGNSQECQQFLSQVTRTPLDAPINPGRLLGAVTLPINIANELVAGVTLNATYQLDTDRAGQFTFSGDYNRTTKHEFQQFPEDAKNDYLDYTYSNEFHNIAAATIGWEKNKWSANLRGTRFSPTGSNGTNADGEYFGYGTWTVYNASVQYAYEDDLTFTLSGSNIFNKRPPEDKTNTAYPFYNVFNYNNFGRLVMFEVAMKFGGDSN